MRKRDFQIVQSIIIATIILAALALLGAIFGVFYAPYIAITWVIACALFHKKKIISFPHPTPEFISYLLIAISFALFVALFTAPTIFSGRDQGSISAAAMQLAQSHSLISYSAESTAFFEIYGPGKALNFPGFHYIADGGLITQFPLPYITFLAVFFATFGTGGFIIANAILLIVFIISITTVARLYLKKKYVYVFLLLLFTTFSIGWFAKHTLSENIANAFLWSSAALYLYLKRYPNAVTFFALITALSLLLFSRIEGIWFFVIFMFLIIRNPSIRTFIREDLWWRGIFPLVTIFSIGCSVLVMNIPFVKTMGDAFFKTATASTSPTTIVDEVTGLFATYSLYGIAAPLVISALFCLIAIKKERFRNALLPIALTFPLFIYYLFPHISGDHPWMLRRFVFALLPTTILITTIFVAYLPKRNTRQEFFAATIITVVLLLQLPAFLSFATYAENTQLKKQVHEFSLQFSHDDLLLIDMETAQSGWSMITEPLRQLENVRAVYFFNPEDFEKLDLSKFDDVFLIVPQKNDYRYQEIIDENFSYYSKYSFTTNQIQTRKFTEPQLALPAKKNTVTRSTIYKLTR